MEKILRVTLDIIHVLTGQDDVVVKRSGDLIAIDPPPPAPTRNDTEKILGLIHKMVALLSGERSADTTTDIWEDVARIDLQTVRSSVDEPDVTSKHTRDVKSEKKSWNITVRLNSRDEGNLQDGGTDRSAEYTQVRVKVEQDANDGGHVPTTYETEERSSLNIKEEPVSGDEAEASSAPAGHSRRATSQIKEESALNNVKEEEILRDTKNYSSTSHVKVKADPSEDDDRRDDNAPPPHAPRRINVSEMFRPNADDVEQDCRKCSPNRLERARHQTAHTVEKAFSERGKSVLSKPSVVIRQKVPEPLDCSQCGQKFVFKSHLIRHQMNHPGGKTFSCQECGKSFGSEVAIMAHRKLHAEKASYACPECGKSFGSEAAIMAHRKLHGEKASYACPECRKSFGSEAAIMAHKKLHAGKVSASYACPECGKSFGSEVAIVAHKKLHAEKASYTCPECGKSFGQKNNLQRHLSVHTGEKPHACAECGKRFLCKSNLTQHLSVHRPKKKETFCCAQCGKCYKRGADYRWHMLIHLGEK